MKIPPPFHSPRQVQMILSFTLLPQTRKTEDTNARGTDMAIVRNPFPQEVWGGCGFEFGAPKNQETENTRIRGIDARKPEPHRQSSLPVLCGGSLPVAAVFAVASRVRWLTTFSYHYGQTQLRLEPCPRFKLQA